jgi:iron complex outermembrane recepter protein
MTIQSPVAVFLAVLLACSALAPVASRAQAAAATSNTTLEEVVITSTLRDRALAQTPASVTVIDATTLAAAGVQHFEDVLGLVPDLNWAAGTSRPRYFQLRGIGELDQYQGAPNPSVGLLIDDIDFSGIGMPATLFDTARVEVLRGPQGAVYGANALAGLISIRSEEPRPGFEARTELSLGNYGVRSAGLVAGDGVDDGTAAWRLVAQRYRGDGFRRNIYLDRDDTNGFDESLLRGKLHWQPGADLRLDLTALLSDIDNGYDAWTIDRTRNTRSDRPGRDAQRSQALALRANYSGFDAFDLLSISTFADSDMDYSFDGDWGNDAFWGANGPYDFFESILRERRTWTQELRASSHAEAGRMDWVAGIYALRLTEAYALQDEYNGAVVAALDSDYAATNFAAYGEVGVPLGARLKLTANLRAERRDADYHDSDGLARKPVDDMLGGQLSLGMAWRDGLTQYLALSRGYKAGGFNIGTQIPDARRLYDPEFLWNIETGLRLHAPARRIDAQATLFYMRRKDQQVSTSYQPDLNDPLTFVQLTDNASAGENYGLEAQLGWRPVEHLQLGTGVALLHTRFIGYRYNNGDGELDLDGRAQPHAPGYQYNLSADYHSPRGAFARVDLQGVAPFYFSSSNAERSQAYRLVNLRAGYATQRWSASLWVRNLFNAAYATRGFFFGIVPPDYTPARYVQQGDPRQLGATLTVSF